MRRPSPLPVVTYPLVGQKKCIAVIPGDGIGPDVFPRPSSACRRAARPSISPPSTGVRDRYLGDGVTVPPDGFAMLGREFDAILTGAFGDPRVPSNIHAKEILLGMRFQMDLYANVRPAVCWMLLSPAQRRRSEGCGLRRRPREHGGSIQRRGWRLQKGTADEVAIQEDINTRKGVERIIRYAFQYAENHTKIDGTPLNRVLMCDKSNALTHAGGLWQRVFKEVGAEYPQIKAEHMYVDALCLQMVRDPRQFDVIVTNNMFGDIITDLAAALQGGLGMAASGNIHPGKTSMFEPVHGSAPPLAGKDVANPFGAILTAAMMLAHLGMKKESVKIDAAVLEAVRQNKLTGASWRHHGHEGGGRLGGE